MLVAGRDEVFHRWMGEGSPDPRPTFVITVDGGDTIAGWVDADLDTQHEWLAPGEVNCGYSVFAAHRGRGLATRSTMLLLHHLAQSAPDVHTATLLIDEGNDGSLGIARRCGFVERPTPKAEQRFFARTVPPLTYTDGTVTIRRPTVDDAEAHTAMIDDLQIDWLWEPEHRGLWEAKTPAEQLAHQRAHLLRVHDEFTTGPKWTFAVEVDGEYVGHVDADLCNPHVAPGDANVSYTMAPAHRGNGYVSRAVRLVLRFIAEHTGAREAHIVVHPDNIASLRVASAVGAPERERYVDHHGATMVRHVLPITR